MLPFGHYSLDYKDTKKVEISHHRALKCRVIRPKRGSKQPLEGLCGVESSKKKKKSTGNLHDSKNYLYICTRNWRDAGVVDRAALEMR